MDLADAMSMLARTPDVVGRLLADLPPEWVHRNDGPGTWSAYDIVGHLVHGEATDWMPRVRMILRDGTSRPFEPFDRESMLDREPAPAPVLLAELASARRDGIAELSALGLTAADLDRRGLHPDLGEVTLGQLLSTWVAHDLAHIGQIGEVLARHYRDAVGPWRAYLPALDRVADAE
jgi:uncharacterized damage-inducible protein DinB